MRTVEVPFPLRVYLPAVPLIAGAVTAALGGLGERIGETVGSSSVDAKDSNLRRDLFFEDVARAYDVGLNTARRHLAEGKDAEKAVQEALVTCLHNVFVTFDHGTKLPSPSTSSSLTKTGTN